MGVETIRELAALPMDKLIERFGQSYGGISTRHQGE